MKRKIFKILLIFGLYKTSSLSANWDFLSVDGYGALGFAYQDNDNVLYRNSYHTVKGSQGDVAFSNYSNFGLQLEASVTDDVTMRVQGVLSENNSNGDLFELGWANISYEINDDLNIRVGKMRIPTFMYSDILNVSYAYDWVKLPEMYSIIPFNNYVGVELNHNLNFDDLSIVTTLLYGRAKSVLVASLEQESILKLKEMKGVGVKLSYDNLTLRFTYNMNNLNVQDKNLDAINLQLTSLGIPIIYQTIDKYMPKKIEYWEFGGKYEFENSYVLGEYMEINSKSFLADNASWYVGTGYNFENWSPFFLYSKSKSSSNYKDIPINANMPIPVAGVLTMTNQILDSISKLNSIESETKSVGLRYNLHDSAVLKFQYDHHQELKDEGLSFNLNQDSNVDLHVFSTAINFVF